ncbi:MAG: zf-HC2 domain-containing protein, partial [Acidobacteriota bacterium]|nr:zf-HC2 domain-containing protein [Acidobacteriota bacterium]
MRQDIYHVSEDRLELYAMNRLTGVELESLEEHLLICEPCQVRLDQTETYVHAMRSSLAALRAAPVPESMWDKLRDAIGDWGTSSVPAFAGGLALVALVLGISMQLPRAGTTRISTEPVTVRLEAMKGESENSVANRP